MVSPLEGGMHNSTVTGLNRTVQGTYPKVNDGAGFVHEKRSSGIEHSNASSQVRSAKDEMAFLAFEVSSVSIFREEKT
jgi:hypothetical protein